MSIFTYTTLDDAQAAASAFAGTLAYGINASGQVVGYYTNTTGGGTHGFLYSGGTYTNFDDPDAGNTGQTYGQGINNLGQIAGYYINGPQELGFIKTGSSYPFIVNPNNVNNVTQARHQQLGRGRRVIHGRRRHSRLRLSRAARCIRPLLRSWLPHRHFERHQRERHPDRRATSGGRRPHRLRLERSFLRLPSGSLRR
jgi:probable HAF family extracellular repeat protein